MVKTHFGRFLRYIIDPWVTVELLKWMIQESEGIPLNNQALIFKDRTLKDNLTMGQLKIGFGSELDVIYTMRGD